MPSFTTYLSIGAAVGGVVVMGAPVEVSPSTTPTATITPPPRVLQNRDFMINIDASDIDAVSLAEVLLTAVPQSLRQLAATNVPAVSSILWEEFLDDKRPEWFRALPVDIQSYLVKEFGPATAAVPTPTATGGESSGDSPSASAPQSESPVGSTSVVVSAPSSAASESSGSPSATEPRSSETFATSIASSQSPSQSKSASPSLSTRETAPTESLSSPSSSTTSTADPATGGGGLSHNQKVGIGVGVPFGILGAAALGLGCCFFLRRRKARKDGSVPPSSPGFIPRFAFQEKNDSENDLRQPLQSHNNINHHSANPSYSAADMGAMDWDDDVFDDDRHRYPTPSPPVRATRSASAPALAPAPVIKPVLHTHSSNRARGKRTSYTSLHSVPEEREREVDEQQMAAIPRSPVSPISPIMPVGGKGRTRSWTPLQSRSSLLTSPDPAAAASTPQRPLVKRKPVSGEVDLGSLGLLNESSGSAQSLLQRQHEQHDSGYGSSSTQERPSLRSNSNPFSNDYSYVEDYGAEFHHGYENHGERSVFVNQSPMKTKRKVYSKTEWPLRNVGSHGRNKSPLWDRVYDGSS